MIIQIKILFLSIFTLIYQLFFHFTNILASNYFGIEGAKAIAKALKLNKNLTLLTYCKFFILFPLNINYFATRIIKFYVSNFFRQALKWII